ncbi:MAG: UDP-N-acetylglucosamine 2-epimerase [Bacteroidales bacterium]|nr:UDP-N-acetylglucosamine 2-epimerase [Bacteroidales bacterium]
MDSRRKIAIATSTRADWGLLSPLARALSSREDCEVTVVATNMHLLEGYGHTVDEIRQDGFEPRCVPMTFEGDSDVATAKAMAQCLSGMAEALDEIRPDMLVLLGDRYEMLAVASAATLLRIPICHIAGGAISQGAIDDQIRHAITKLSSLHLTETEEYRQRVIQMGEAPDRVLNTGAIGVSGLSGKVDRNAERYNMILVTMHPATMDPAPVEDRINAMLEALDKFPEYQILITYPNNDPRGRVIIERIHQWADSHENAMVVKSLGHKRYLEALGRAKLVVGNSSSGIVEAPSFGIPTIDIGIRQRGRTAAESVIHCGDSAQEIAQAIENGLSKEFQALAKSVKNPYEQADTLGRMVQAVATYPLEPLRHKTFVDYEKR